MARMELEPNKKTLLFLLFIHFLSISGCLCFNVGTSGAKLFSGPELEEFGYTVQQFSNHQGKWLLVGSPWSGFRDNRKGDVYRCDITSPSSTCQKLNLQDSISLTTVKDLDVNMSLGLTLTRTAKDGGFLTCGPLWAQKCGRQYYLPGICAEVSPLFSPLPAFAPALQTCGGPMDLVIVLDGSNSIYPWPPVTKFLQQLLKNMDIGPDHTQVSILQYGEDTRVEFHLDSYSTKDVMVAAASRIPQKYGMETNTFNAIEYARRHAFLPQNGARPGATKVMVIVTDGESHDKELRDEVISKCQADDITRFGIAVLGYYNRHDQDTTKLVEEIKSIASLPTARHFFNVSEEAALIEIAGTLGDRIFNIEGTGQGGDFQMEMSQVGFSAHQTRNKDMLMLGAVGAYSWSGTVVHHTPQKSVIFPKSTFNQTLQDRNDSSLLGYSVTTLYDGSVEYYVAGAPRSNHTGQVIVYTLTTRGQPNIVHSQRGDQIGSYYGSVLCPVDVDHDGVSDLLLVSAPSFMSHHKKETGKVYILAFTEGVLGDKGSLSGPSPVENARFGQAMAAVWDLNLDGLSDVVVGAPLEDDNTGAVYVFNGHRANTLTPQYSQRIKGSKVDPGLKYFGRSLDANSDLNDDLIPDVSVGGYGKVVQLWSRGVAVVTAMVTFDPAKISVLSKDCQHGNRAASCFTATVCFSAEFSPSPPVGPLGLRFNLTLDADLQSSRVASRGHFTSGERVEQGELRLQLQAKKCDTHLVYVQDAPDFVSPLALRVDVAPLDPEASPVLDQLRPMAWAFSVPFAKDCGPDDICQSDLSLRVKTGDEVPSSSKMLVSFKNKRLSFIITVGNKKESAYNTRVTVDYSSNLYYASVTLPSDGSEVKCSSISESQSLSCQVGYPALAGDEEVTFVMNFDFNLNEKPLQSDASVTFTALSDSTESQPSNNQVSLTIPVLYDSDIALSRESNMNFYVVDGQSEVKTTITSLDDIGPEFNFVIKVSTGNFPVGRSFLTVSLLSDTKAGNPLLYVTGVKTQPSSDVSCDVKIAQMPSSASFSKENLLSTERLDCQTASCQPIKCVLKDMTTKSDFYVNMTTRIWNGTFATASFQSLLLAVTAEIKTDNPDLLIVSHPELMVGVTLSKPGEKGEVPVGVIVGSIIGGLLLLALLIVTLWKLGFFKRKYQQLQKTDGADEAELEGLHDNQA